VLGLIGKNKGGRARRIILEPKLVVRGTSERKPAVRRKAKK
jgi:hypothetical protein